MQKSVTSGLRFSELWRRSAAVRYQTTTAEQLPPVDIPTPVYDGPNYSWVTDVRKRLLNPSLTTNFSTPLLLHCGYMQYVWDHEGNRYLDLFGGIATVSVGHCHPKVHRAVEEQMNKLCHTSNIYLHPKIHEFAYHLTKKLPKDLNVVYFVNSGSEANDLAMTLARLYTGRFDIISLRNGYHGASHSTMGLSGQGNRKYNIASSFGIHQVSNPDTYQGLWGGYRDSPVQSLRAGESNIVDGECLSADKYVDQIREVLLYSVPNGKPAAFFAEPIQGGGGTVQYPLGYLKKAFDLIRQNGGLCVADEVQTGFGRTGDHFWGFESHGVVPDIVTMAKGIGNGFPLAAVVTTQEVARTMTTAEHFNTFGGNPVSCAVGASVLQILEEEKTQEISRYIGTYFLKELEKLRDDFEVVGDVRGKGLMIGVELVTDKETRTPLVGKKFMNIWDSCKNMGVILGRGGRFGNVFRIKPPMCITKNDVDFAIKVMRKSLEINC